MTRLKLFGGIAGLVLVVGFAIWLVALVREKDRLAGVEHRFLACEAAVTNGESLTTNCPQAISDAATRGRRYLDCDAAMAKADLYGVRAACSAAVKWRDAEATALAGDKAQLADELARERRSSAAALKRAGARTETLIRKDRDAQAALAGAPRSADGRIRCDDQCLRRLAGD